MTDRSVRLKPAERPQSLNTDLLLLAGIFAGPIAWAADHTISYSLVPHACSTGHHYILHVCTAVALLVTLAGFMCAMNVQQRMPDDTEQSGGSVFDRERFMALLGMAMSVAFCMVIIASAIPRWFMDPCAQ